MPITKVCASAPNTSSVVAVRPTTALRCAKCHAYATRAAAYRMSGAAAISVRLRAWGEITLLGARRRARAIGAHDDAPPRTIPLRVLRRVADRVLARELVRNLAVDAGELVDVVREERAPAG